MEAASTYVVVPFLSAFFNVLVDRLASEKMRELLMGHTDSAAAADELSELRISMTVIKRAVNVAEEKQEIDHDVKNWLDDVKHAFYDAEDLVDFIHTQALRRQVQQSHNKSNKRKACQMFIDSVTSAFAAVNPFHEGIETIIKIRKLNQRFEGLSTLIQALGLMHSPDKQSQKILVSQPTSSFVDESKIVGRVSERDQIIQVLDDGVSRYHQRSMLKGKNIPIEDNIRVIAIVGMGGIGKTTLAQLVYNYPKTDSMFNLKTWIYVPREFYATQIISKILDLLPGTSVPFSKFKFEDNLQLLQKNLREKVMGRRIMIILDGLWDEISHDTWQKVLISLEPAAPGSTIIVTTRNEGIARNFRPILIVPLYKLPDDDVWTLFKAHAFGDPQAAPVENFETIGRKALVKCGGLPLAIRALGRLLNKFLSDANKWETIANNKLWDSHPSVRKEILPALLLSFYYLPEPVKRCYAYCSIFPKNYQYDKENLVLLWMAEGFIEMPRSNSNETMESLGMSYFDDLKAQSFFQVSNSERSYFVMHDLIHDLAIFVMGEFGLMLEPNISSNVEGRLRHFSYKPSKYDTNETYKLIAHADQMRTFFPIASITFSSDVSCYYLSKSVLQSLNKFDCLRVFSLCGYKITSIPPSIGSLELLRYLDFSLTHIEELPDTIGDLSHLQTLLLRHCQQLKRLPSTTSNLVHLRHLDISGTDELQEMPDHIGRLSRLQTLPYFIVGLGKGNSVRELGRLTQLRGSLRISGLENVSDERDVDEANLGDKADLVELVLMKQQTSVNAGRYHVRLLQALKPHTNLRRLTIQGYGGVDFPDWVGNEAFHYLEFLYLNCCPYCETLPPLGYLPSLKHLIVEDFNRLENVGAEFYGQHNGSSSPFKSLVTLEFKRLRRWKKWFAYEGEVKPFPCLEKLSVQDCKVFKGNIPLTLPSLVDLDIRYCDWLDGSLPELLNLRKLRLEEFGSLVLTSLVRITYLTELSLCNLKGGEDDWIANAKEALPLMTSLERLTIKNISECTPKGWHLPSSVRSLTVLGIIIQPFESFIEGCKNLQHLSIKGFNSLIQFPPGHSQLLNNLDIECCNKIQQSQIVDEGDELGLKSLNEMRLSRLGFGELNRGFLAARNLTTLTLYQCLNLRSLPNGMANHFLCLQFLCIHTCPLFQTFPEVGLPPNLQTLKLKDCMELRSLSNHMTTCKSLQRLTVRNCSKLESLPERGMPPNLKYLKLSKTLNYAEWQLYKLKSLQQLKICFNEHEEVFPANGSLPVSLTFLKIFHFQKLKSLNCGDLQSIPCLRELEIECCESLLSLCDGGLPHSLYRFTVVRSPKFAKRFCKPDGHYVDMTSHITCLQIGWC